jgi:hypothetical protein
LNTLGEKSPRLGKGLPEKFLEVIQRPKEFMYPATKMEKLHNTFIESSEGAYVSDVAKIFSK